VVLIGIAQEKTPVWRSWKAKGQEHAAHPHMEWARQMGFVNHFYFYLWDPDWGGAFWKTNAYAPWPVWLWLNGHTWAQRQCQRLGIGYTALDNGFRACDDPEALQRICDRLGPGAPAPHGFTVSEFAAKVHAMTGTSGIEYSVRQAAYDLRKLRGKRLVDKPGRTRRYHVPPQAARTIAAMLTLRDQVIAPILAAVRSPRMGRKPAHWTRVDRDYEQIRIDMQTLFTDLALETPSAA
jgi:hypothetical protein